MRFGCCVDLDSAETAQNAGFDYIELPVAAVRAESPDSEFEPVIERVKELEIVPEVWNCLLTGSMRITGPEVDRYRIERYLRTAFARIEELGGEIVVFASGCARNVPDGFSRDEATEQIVDFVTLAGGIAGSHGITIAIEPLNSTDCNIINTTVEALEIVRAADHPFVKMLVDLYHMEREGEPLSHIAQADGAIVHAHTADSDRLCPGTGKYPNEEFLRALRSAGHDERVSIECVWRDLAAEAPRSLAFLRELDSRVPA